MFSYLERLRPAILDTLRDALEGERAALSSGFPAIAADLTARLYEYAARGKILRGCLVRLGFELCGGDASAEIPARDCRLAGAAMELFQSGLLVHDDIMDRDATRRGAPTIHAAFETMLGADGSAGNGHNGMSLAICAGDLAYFIGFCLLARLGSGAPAVRAVSSLSARELALVSLAQMRDVANGAVRDGGAGLFGEPGSEPAEASILSLYRHKTGRYTFSLPLAMGCALASGSKRLARSLEEAGECLGVAFQLRDDELGLFAAPETLGKPVGSDLRENKKTILRSRLLAAADRSQADALAGVYGNPEAGLAELAMVRELTVRLGVLESARATMRAFTEEALRLAAPVLKSAPAEARKAFEELAAYNLERGK